MKELFTRKLYFREFDYRLQVKCKSSWNHDKTAPCEEVIKWLLNNKAADHKFKVTTSQDWSNKSLNASVFFKDNAVFDLLKTELGEKHFLEYEKPLSATHTKILGDDEKLITRKDLFYKKYRIVFRADAEKIRNGYWHNTSTTKLREMEQWCRDQWGEGGRNDDVFRVDIWSKGIFYFADSKDALLFKLTWGGEAKMTTERVMLISEVEAKEAAA